MGRSIAERYRDWLGARAYARGPGRLPTAAERAEILEAVKHLRPIPLRDILKKGDPYVEEANANPERRNNGCQIYRVGSNG